MQQTCRTAVGPARQPQRCPLRSRVRSRRLFGRFENLVSPYPEGAPRSPPQSFVAFIWACSQGMRPILLGMTLCTAVIAMFEALLFSMLGHVVDWLTAVEPAQFWAKERGKLLFLAAIIAASPLVVALEAFLKHQALAANFPSRSRATVSVGRLKASRPRRAGATPAGPSNCRAATVPFRRRRAAMVAASDPRAVRAK